jgi:hypothetical protein
MFPENAPSVPFIYIEATCVYGLKREETRTD